MFSIRLKIKLNKFYVIWEHLGLWKNDKTYKHAVYKYDELNYTR